jgi:hypothetical protein
VGDDCDPPPPPEPHAASATTIAANAAIRRPVTPLLPIPVSITTPYSMPVACDDDNYGADPTYTLFDDIGLT